MAAVAVLEAELAGNFIMKEEKNLLKLISFHYYFDKDTKKTVNNNMEETHLNLDIMKQSLKLSLSGINFKLTSRNIASYN
jgi:hypothetical protein